MITSCAAIILPTAMTSRAAMALGAVMTTRVFPDSSFSTAPAAISYAHFPLFLFFYCPCTRWTTRVFLCFSFSTAPGACILRAFSLILHFLLPPVPVSYARFPLFLFFYCPRCLYPTRVFADFSFSTALARAALRAFSPILLFLLPPATISYARFPLFFFFYCPRRRYLTRVFHYSSFSTALGACILRAFSPISLFLLPRWRYLTRVFTDFSFSTATVPISYARFHRFFIFYCPRRLYPTRVFTGFSFSTALARARLRAFSGNSHFTLRAIYPLSHSTL